MSTVYFQLATQALPASSEEEIDGKVLENAIVTYP